jgi:hypothetical protein
MASEYREFRIWSQQMANRLAARGESGLLPFLQEVHALNTDLLDVCDALAELRRGSPWDLWRNVRLYARLIPDPLRYVRAHMRLIRSHYGELPGLVEKGSE